MLKTVFITRLTKFLPNKAVTNDELEDYLGKINGLRSKSKALILRSNGIVSRHYAMNLKGEHTHNNVDLTVEAIKLLQSASFSLNDIELLACGTASPDQLMPSHSSMVHGKLKINPIDAMTATGSCNSSMWALNYAWMSLLTGKYKNAVCTGSEKISSWMQSKLFKEESSRLEALGENPYIAFEKEFLRWMLSDGAGAALLQTSPNPKGLSLQIDWIDIRSFANQTETCMYAGAKKDENGELIPWRNMENRQLVEESIFALKQDSKLLEMHITSLGGKYLTDLMEKYNFTSDSIDYLLPHMSSEFFRKKIQDSMLEQGINIPEEKWFTNLDRIGNVGSASGFLMLEELLYSNKLRKGNTILVMIPESARFSYTYVHLTVV
jgi:3-oxoacyl-[acyl-carrier-protein] synthase-3